MASSYIGLHVSLALNDSPQPLVGTITQIDVERNLLVLTRQGGAEPVQVDKARIRGISVVSAPTNANATADATTQSSAPAMTSSASASSSINGAGATDFRAPEAAKLPKPSRSARAGQSNSDANGLSGSSSSGISRRKKKGKKGASSGAAQGSQTPDEHDHHGHTRASSSLSEDFDFEASAKHFDKAAIWEQIRAQDRSDPAALLVSHNRRGGDTATGADLVRGRSGTPVGLGEGGKMRKLRIDENVLSPSPEEEKSEEKGGLAGKNTAAEAGASQVQPAPALTSTTSAAGSATDNEALQRENASLRRRLYILENLSGLSIQDFSDEPSRPSAGSDQQQVEFQVSLSPPALPGSSPAPTPGQSHPVTFYLQTSLEVSDSKLRFKPTSSALNGSSSGSGSGSGSGKLPEKYNREMGLRLDNGSARVFMERLRGAL